MSVSKGSWALVLHNPTTVLSPVEIEKACNLFGVKYSILVTICSTIKSDGKLEISINLIYVLKYLIYFRVGDVDLATAKEIVVGWWGQGHPPVGHILSEGPYVNTIVCHPLEEETMVAAEATGWIAYL